MPAPLPAIGTRVQVTIGVYKGRTFQVIGGYADQVELGDAEGRFWYCCNVCICRAVQA